MTAFRNMASDFVYWLVAGTLLITVVILVMLGLSGARLENVLTESMTASAMPVGTLVAVVPVEASEIQAGDAIVARSPLMHLVLHEAQGEPVKDRAGNLVLKMKGTSNGAGDAWSYDVTAGAHKVIWSAPGLGLALIILALPAVVFLFVWAFGPSKKPATQEVRESATS